MSECPTANIHVTCDNCDHPFAGGDNINFVLSINDDRDKSIRYFCCVNCVLDYMEVKFCELEHIVETNKMVSDSKTSNDSTAKIKKLKPVDENCLYKPVRSKGFSGKIILLKLPDKESGFSAYFVENNCMAENNYYERIEDYDYGDGVNYL